MKVCPRCQKTYQDDNLNFCLEDGTVLQAGGPLPETVMINQARLTDPSPNVQTQGARPIAWANPPAYAAPAKKSSKTWLWVVGILGLVVLLCGGGFVGLVFIGMAVDQNSNTAGSSVSNARTSPTTGPSAIPDSRNQVQAIDLSEWVRDFSAYGVTEYKDGEFLMSSKQKKFYYVLVASEEYSTENATTKVTLRNVDSAPSSLGYGLIFHSDPSPLTKDYAFLIDTQKQRYRVVRHEPQKETVMVPWTTSTTIKQGSQENVIEARDKGDATDLFVNGQVVNQVKNNFAYKGGVAGLYSGDAVKIAFKNMEIRK
jgi:hypothetical protein